MRSSWAAEHRLTAMVGSNGPSNLVRCSCSPCSLRSHGRKLTAHVTFLGERSVLVLRPSATSGLTWEAAAGRPARINNRRETGGPPRRVEVIVLGRTAFSLGVSCPQTAGANRGLLTIGLNASRCNVEAGCRLRIENKVAWRWNEGVRDDDLLLSNHGLVHSLIEPTLKAMTNMVCCAITFVTPDGASGD
jgi:hypothetical protein